MIFNNKDNKILKTPHFLVILLHVAIIYALEDFFFRSVVSTRWKCCVAVCVIPNPCSVMSCELILATVGIFVPRKLANTRIQDTPSPFFSWITICVKYLQPYTQWNA